MSVKTVEMLSPLLGGCKANFLWFNVILDKGKHKG